MLNSENTMVSEDRSAFKRQRTLTLRPEPSNPIRLVHENIELREQLKYLNLKLNQLLDEKSSKKKGKLKHSNPENILVMAQKQIDHYESEKTRLQNRIQMLSDPEYILKLKTTLEKHGEEIAILTNVNHSFKVQEKKIGKLLGDILETGETIENSKEFQQLVSQKFQLLTLIKNRKKKNNDIESRIEIAKNQYLLLREDLDKLKEFDLKQPPGRDFKHESRLLKAEFERKNKLFEQKERALKNKLSNLNIQLKQLKDTENNLADKFQISGMELSKQNQKLKMIKSVENFKSPRDEDLSIVASLLSPKAHSKFIT